MEDLDAVLARMKHMSQLTLSNNSSYSYVPAQPFQPQPRAASTSYCFRRAQNRPFQKVNHPGISRIIFPTRKRTGSKQIDSKRYRAPFQAGNLQNCSEQWTRIKNNPSVLNVIQGHRIQFHTQPPIQPAPDLKYSNVSLRQEHLIDQKV